MTPNAGQGARLVRDALMQRQGVPSVQRNRSDEDCAVAAVANTIGVPYETAAEAFGFPVLRAGGAPSAPPGRGFHVAEIGPALERLGYKSVTVATPQVPAQILPQAPRAPILQLRRELKTPGRTAIVFTSDADDEGHCLALRQGALVDPRAASPYGKSLDTVDILAAVFITGPARPQAA